MEKKEIKVYTKMNNVETNDLFLAIKDKSVIKYIDLENNKMEIDMENDIIKRENNDYVITISLNENIITIFLKKLKMKLLKEIKTMLIKKTKKTYLVRYELIDENEVNEYYVNF